MKFKSFLMIAAGALALLAVGDGNGAQAGDRRGYAQDSAEHPMANRYRKTGPRVYGYAARRGGYSYSPEDVINTYGLTRNKYGSTNSYRDPSVDRQTNNGPFDHGFFRDSATGLHGGDSPYQH
jgi:hypothetical protein